MWNLLIRTENMFKGTKTWMLVAVAGSLLIAGSVRADFVDDMETGDPPARWVGDTAIISAETENVYAGNQSLRIENKGGQITGAAFSVADPRYFAVTPGVEYTLTYWYFGIDTSVYHGIYVFNVDGQPVWSTADFGWTENAWATYTYSATMPADADHGYMGFFPTKPQSTAIIDDVSFVGPDVAMPGDANLDGVVNDADLSLLLAHWDQDVTGEPDGGWGKGEFDAVAPVQDSDLSLLLANWTVAGAVPEPASGTLLLLGAAGFIKRRPKA